MTCGDEPAGLEQPETTESRGALVLGLACSGPGARPLVLLLAFRGTSASSKVAHIRGRLDGVSIRTLGLTLERVVGKFWER